MNHALQHVRNSFTRVLLVTLCYLTSPWHVSARRPIDPKTCQRIMILALAQLGDTVAITPLIRQVRVHYPQARIYVASKAAYRDLLAHNNDIDEFVAFSEEGVRDFITYVKRAHIDVAVLPQANAVALAGLYLGGVRHIITIRVVHEVGASVSSYDRLHDTASFNALRSLVVSLPLRVGYNMLKEHLTLLEPLGIVTSDTRSKLGYSEGARAVVNAFYTTHGITPNKDFIVIIFPSSGNKAKNWVASRFAEVAEYVQKTYGAKVVIIGGPTDTEEVSNVLKSLPPGVTVVDASNAFALDELKAFIASANLFISVDAGPLHIAIAFDVPTIDILGPAPDWVAYQDEFHLALSNRGDAEPAMHPLRNREFDYAEARRQAEAITTAQVTHAVDKLHNLITSRSL